ncbi:MAG: alpha-galactosidase, partial [Chloroflexi bacterium]|nr:alpha-galactosidase [Chloroflexota bacterium]
WFESQHLPEEAYGAAEAIQTYRQHQRRIHAGRIWPIGEEPSGLSWTGFQSEREGGGYLAVYRERTERASARLRVRGAAGRRVVCEPIIGQGAPLDVEAGADGVVTFALPTPWSYALYAYTIA